MKMCKNELKKIEDKVKYQKIILGLKNKKLWIKWANKS